MKEKNIPKYLQLKQEILSWIHSGKLSPDEKIPTEHEIASQFQLSRHTVRQALGELEKEGWLYKIQGSGTFVSKPKQIGKIEIKTVGILTTYISDYIFPHIVRGAEETLREKGYRLLLASTDNNKEREREHLEAMINQPLSGLIIEPTKSAQGNPNLGYYLALNNLNIPYVMINERYLEMSCPYIKMDDEGGGFLLTDHLIDLGHRRIAGFFKTDDLQGVNRLKGFIRAHQEHGVSLSTNNLISYTTEEKETKPLEIARFFLQQPEDERPTAFVCYNDELAIKLLDVIRQQGLVVPEDISVVGFDDSTFATATEVKLTTIRHPKEEMGIKAAEMLIQMIEKQKDDGIKDIIYKPELIVRESAKRI
ncbi:GntR family transcriptional regulator [Thermaerobacillus caldiproteolyticus]|uniref:GntR family transcriptional regulator n=1 Tax=Thermaerobacillus caldiproteolyticus TaxID=247480 RepID=UPI00188C00BC|nr:GntR family transcriptional regulator [Anoxybacillus caldiproteolyticus]QPA32375.1 GntR family transcriptional regulator [Anoxybacillus caldiproteolyticus]